MQVRQIKIKSFWTLLFILLLFPVALVVMLIAIPVILLCVVIFALLPTGTASRMAGWGFRKTGERMSGQSNKSRKQKKTSYDIDCEAIDISSETID